MKVLRLKLCMLVREKECMDHLFLKTQEICSTWSAKCSVLYGFSDKSVLVYYSLPMTCYLCHINQIIERKKNH